MRRVLTLISVALLLTGWSATAGLPRTETQQKLSRMASAEPLRSSSVGIFAMRMSGDTLVDINRMVKLVPASNMKLITTGLALRRLGADFRFETRIAYSGKIEDGTLKGDLYIVGGGDPTTGSNADCAEPLGSLFSKWAGFISDAGISRIEGRVIADPRVLGDAVPVNLNWNFEDLGTNYGAGPTGLNFFENAQNFYVTPGSAAGLAPYVTTRYPETPWMKYVNAATTGGRGSSNSVVYIPERLGPEGMFYGSFPIDRKGYTLECSNAFAAYTCAYYFCRYLRTHRIAVDGGFADINSFGYIRTEPGSQAIGTRAAAQRELSTLGSTWSAPLSEIIAETNCESDNFFAETLLRTAGLKACGSYLYEDCCKVEEDALKTMGVRVSGACQIIDGSGLSRKNYVSPDFFVSYLRSYASTADYGTFLSSLPVPGRKGTIKDKFPNTSESYRSRFHFKSGSMNGVRCYSGYILSEDGDPSKTIVFSLMLNNVTVSSWAINPYIDGIIEAIAAGN